MEVVRLEATTKDPTLKLKKRAAWKAARFF
jgi:hypothetical protein